MTTTTTITPLGLDPTPLVPLRRMAPAGVAVYAKCEWHLPTGSVKDRVAAAMVADARERGLLQPGVRLLEASSGNTGIALARLARLQGVPLTVVMPDNVGRERTDLLAAFGAEVVHSFGSEGSNGAVRLAEDLAARHGYLMLHQYENPANPRAHELSTGPEIVRDLERLSGSGRLDAFVACLGTGGTLMGVGRVLRPAFPGIRIVAAEPPAGEVISGLRSLADGYVPPVFDPSAIDGRMLVRTRHAIVAARRLLDEEGLFVGPSSGAAVHVALRVAERLEPGAVVVALLPDAGWKYLSSGFFSGSVDEAERRVLGKTLW